MSRFLVLDLFICTAALPDPAAEGLIFLVAGAHDIAATTGADVERTLDDNLCVITCKMPFTESVWAISISTARHYDWRSLAWMRGNVGHYVQRGCERICSFCRSPPATDRRHAERKAAVLYLC